MNKLYSLFYARVSVFVCLLALTSIACSAQSDPVEKVVFKETRLEILDDYLSENPQNCNKNRRSANRFEDSYFNATTRSAPSEAASIILNEIFCEAGFDGVVDKDSIFLATMSAVNVSKFPEAAPVEHLHLALSIVATWEVYPDAIMSWAAGELVDRNLPIFGTDDYAGVGSVKSRQRRKGLQSLVDLADALSEGQ